MAAEDEAWEQDEKARIARERRAKRKKEKPPAERKVPATQQQIDDVLTTARHGVGQGRRTLTPYETNQWLERFKVIRWLFDSLNDSTRQQGRSTMMRLALLEQAMKTPGKPHKVIDHLWRDEYTQMHCETLQQIVRALPEPWCSRFTFTKTTVTFIGAPPEAM